MSKDKDTAEQFLEDNKELMDDLAKLEELEKSLIEACNQSLADMGEPEYRICGHCSRHFSKDEFIIHTRDFV
jgi:hypothetical protein